MPPVLPHLRMAVVVGWGQLCGYLLSSRVGTCTLWVTLAVRSDCSSAVLLLVVCLNFHFVLGPIAPLGITPPVLSTRLATPYTSTLPPHP